jgi:hypothetical protein
MLVAAAVLSAADGAAAAEAAVATTTVASAAAVKAVMRLRDFMNEPPSAENRAIGMKQSSTLNRLARKVNRPEGAKNARLHCLQA